MNPTKIELPVNIKLKSNDDVGLYSFKNLLKEEGLNLEINSFQVRQLEKRRSWKYKELRQYISWLYYEVFLVTRSKRKKSKNTLSSDKSRFNRIIKWFEVYSWSEESIVAFIYHLKSIEKSPGETVNRFRTALISFNRFLKIIDSELWIDVKDLIPVQNVVIINDQPILSPEEIVKMSKIKIHSSRNFDYLNSRNEALILLFGSAGCRVDELRSLVWSDLLVKDKIIIFKDTKNGKEHRLSILEGVFNMVNSLSKVGDYIFSSTRGGKLSIQCINSIIKRCALKAGISKEISSHTFRRSLATHLLEANYSEVNICKLMNWSGPRMLMRYKKSNMEYYSKLVARQPLAGFIS